MIKNVMNSASPAITWFGGMVCVPIACRRKCITTMIRTKDVSVISIEGARERIVSRIIILMPVLTCAVSVESPSDIFIPGSPPVSPASAKAGRKSMSRVRVSNRSPGINFMNL